MAVNLSTLSTRQIENALRRGAKDVLVANGIEPATRRGNKELTLAVQRMAQQTYSTLEEATQTGEALGQKIVELSQAKGKTDLDGGIVRQMMLTGEIPTVVKVTAKPAKTTPVVVDTAPKVATPAAAPPAADEAAVEAEANEPVELEAVGAEIVAEAPSEAIAALDAEELDTSEADVVADDLMAAEALETVDPEIADAPDLEAIETLEPAYIEAPAPEPLTAAETAGKAQ